MNYHNYYLNSLYPLQDKFLSFFDQHNRRRFYLTGGTALSRFYFQHRYSDDLDFFSCEELKDFRSIMNNLLNTAKRADFNINIETFSDHFFRIFIQEDEISLKIDFVNEPVFHFGKFQESPLFCAIDNEKNILANKITCISRHEVKDIADIWVMAKNLSFSWREIIDIANKKSPVDPLEISKIIKTLPEEELNLIKWTKSISWDKAYSDIQSIAKDILFGETNSLVV